MSQKNSVYKLNGEEITWDGTFYYYLKDNVHQCKSPKLKWLLAEVSTPFREALNGHISIVYAFGNNKEKMLLRTLCASDSVLCQQLKGLYRESILPNESQATRSASVKSRRDKMVDQT